MLISDQFTIQRVARKKNTAPPKPTVSHLKDVTILFHVTSPNDGRFSKFFWQYVCIEVTDKDHRTTLQNVLLQYRVKYLTPPRLTQSTVRDFLRHPLR